MTAGTIAQATDKAGTLTEALPYIRTYRGQTVVVKIGGAALADGALADLVAQDLALMALVGIRLVIVHGGGPQVSEAMRAEGVQPEFRGGLRVTGDRAIEVVRRTLIGSINPDLVGRLCRAGLSAMGLSGIDGGLLQARRIQGADGEDIGLVGSVTRVDVATLEALLDRDLTPVLASIAPTSEGIPLNVNADAAAGAIAGALRASKLVYLTNVEGLYRDLGDQGSLISELTLGELSAMVTELSSGMRPKAASAMEALRAGVGKVHILDGRVHHALLLEVFTDEGIGTQVLP